MTGCRPVDTPMDPTKSKLLSGQGEPLSDPARYKRLGCKLNYLTVTRHDISFLVSVVSQFMDSPNDSHRDAVVHIVRYIKSAPGKGLLFEDEAMSRSLDTQMLIGQDHLLIDVLCLDIVF
uniref:Uncharacterized mitochondrial protein AtMg00810-like n=1 Tax=Nicotiana tabacum TaxID=4097 RepID=A0A1S3Y6K7_TOBAC|nr:PREDICTED: uncharacterized mitochondrial protein AtMg00810-like [Nicotiana tabacum]